MKKLSFAWRVTDEEYGANLSGMNTFFGAVLGFVLADVTAPRMIDFAQLLLFTAAIVIGILYVSASSRRWLYAAFNLLLIWLLPNALHKDAGDIGKLQVTLAVWAGMSIFLELLMALSRRSGSTDTPPAAR